jgi:hypothetical protein
MVWNRRKNARPDRGIRGRVNPPTRWVWSSRPTHEPLVTRDLFEAATTIGRFRQGSRSGAAPNRRPATPRTYALRSYLFCSTCGRRLRRRASPTTTARSRLPITVTSPGAGGPGYRQLRVTAQTTVAANASAAAPRYAAT